MQDFLQQENGSQAWTGFRDLTGWQQDSLLHASEDSWFLPKTPDN